MAEKLELQTINEWIAKGSPQFLPRLKLLRNFISNEVETFKRSRTNFPSADFIRALGALADTDAMFRGVLVPLPEWIKSPKINNKGELLSVLRKKYPDPFVEELQALYEVTLQDLPSSKRIVYNPIFGGIDGIGLQADGDLLLGNILIDLKVSVDRFKGKQLWQLLGYVALDRLRGKNRIKKVGLYNPRSRKLWTESIDSLIDSMGGRAIDDFLAWFQKQASPRSVKRSV